MDYTTKQQPFLKTRQLTLTAVMTAVTCILGPFSIPLPFSPVPIALTNLAIYISVFVLGMKLGTVSYVLYMLLGAVGLPVFTGFSGGLGRVAGPTGGYLVGFIFMALITGFFIERFPKKLSFAVIGMVVGTIVCYFFGTIWLAAQMDLSFGGALTSGVIPFIPGDAAKIIIAAMLGPKLRTAVLKLQQSNR